MDDDHSKSGAKPSGPWSAGAILTWTRGRELPPFEADNAAAVELAVALACGRISVDSPVPISRGLALQLYMLLCEAATRPVSCKGLTFAHFLRALSALHFGRPADGATPRLLARMPVHHALLRDEKSQRGLLSLLRESLKRKDSLPELQGMTREEARAHLLMRWDLETMHLTAAGGGGGEPGGSGGGATQEQQPVRPQPRLDIRTRTFAAQVALVASARRVQLQSVKLPTTTWLELGAFPLDVLRYIDDIVRGTRHSRARREETHELQAVALRKQIDEMRAQLSGAEVRASKSEQAAVRSLRAQEAANRAMAMQEAVAAEVLAAERKEFDAQLKEQRAAAAAKLRLLQRDMQAERVQADERITRLQGNITDLERELCRRSVVTKLGLLLLLRSVMYLDMSCSSEDLILLDVLLE